MNRLKRHTRIMWLIVAIIWIACLAIMGYHSNLPAIEPDVCFTDECVCVDDCLDSKGG